MPICYSSNRRLIQTPFRICYELHQLPAKKKKKTHLSFWEFLDHNLWVKNHSFDLENHVLDGK
jgi:hypothetical protein